MKLGAFHLVKISGISGSAVNGTRFVCSSHWKIPRRSGNSKKVVTARFIEFPAAKFEIEIDVEILEKQN